MMVNYTYTFENKNLEDLATIKYGKNQKDVETPVGNYKILGTGGVIGYANSYLYDKPSVLIGRKGTIDKPQFIDEPFWTVDTLFYTEINSGIFPKWLYYALKRIDLKKYNEATGVPSLNVKNLNKIKIATPQKNEQQKIAAILSSVDESIERTEQIIEQNETVKKGLMQQLLFKGVGQNEFKDTKLGKIPAQWDVINLGDIAKEINEKNKEEKINFVLSCTKYDGIVSSLDYFKKQVFSKDISNYKVLKRGQFAYATIHLDEGSIGVLKDFDIGVISPMYTIFETSEEINSDYLFYLLKSDKYIRRYQTLGQGSINRRMSIPFKTLKELKIHYPPKEEQNKIVDIINHTEQKLVCEKNKVQSLENIKQGLMQQLLTGKVRVQINENEEVSS